MAEAIWQASVVEAWGFPRSDGGFFSAFAGSSNVYVSIKVDGQKQLKSASVPEHEEAGRGNTAHFGFRCEFRCPAASSELRLEVKRAGIFGGVTHLGACVFLLQDGSTRIEDQVLPLYAPDGSGRTVGTVRMSLVCVSGGGGAYVAGVAAPIASTMSSVPGGLINRAGTGGMTSTVGAAAPLTSTVGGGYHFGEAPPPLASRAGSSLDYHGSLAGGLTNLAGAGAAAPPACSTALSSSALPGGLTNRSFTHSESFPVDGGGLANLAGDRDDGTRANAVSRAQELLRELSLAFEPGRTDHLQKLQQALESLRHGSLEQWRGSEGRSAIADCSRHIEAVFKHATETRNEREVQSAIWLAGRLPQASEEEGESLQDSLRRRWDSTQMEQAFAQAEEVAPRVAAGSFESLELFMDRLDIAEFHARQAGQDPRSRADALLGRLRPSLEAHTSDLLQQRRIPELEKWLEVVGLARIQALGLARVLQELEGLRGVELLRHALLPMEGQIGYPELKQRQLRNAIMVAKSALSSAGEGANAVQVLLLEELLPVCATHSNESLGWLLYTALELRVEEAEVGAATRDLLEQCDRQKQEDVCSYLPDMFKSWGRPMPKWLLDLLKAMYRLPAGWDVASMLASEKRLLAKIDVENAEVLRVFAELFQSTALPSIRTRDRRGAVPSGFIPVRAVQVMNGRNWQSYVRRRDEIVQQCRRQNVKYDASHWQNNLNGLIMSMALKDKMAASFKDAEALVPEVNEMWLLHGTSHAAADGITSEDFDMTRASPTGLFGAGVYFAESISKSDEYVDGQMVGGQELFPLLLCRVALGHVYYCDELYPDKVKLRDRCLQQDWHSVLGDRKKTRGTFREFIVYDSEQAFPAYIIYYARRF